MWWRSWCPARILGHTGVVSPEGRRHYDRLPATRSPSMMGGITRVQRHSALAAREAMPALDRRDAGREIGSGMKRLVEGEIEKRDIHGGDAEESPLGPLNRRGDERP